MIELKDLSIDPKISNLGETIIVQATAVNIGDEPDSKLVKCEYHKEEVDKMFAKFSGEVSKQEESGEVVTITISLPDGDTETIKVNTGLDKTYLSKQAYFPGNYQAQASIEEDGLYKAAKSDIIPFTIGKLSRTITLVITFEEDE